MDEKQQKEIDKINQMSQFEMCHLWRFSPPGHPYFDSNLPYFDVFEKRLRKLGGFTPEISKALDW